MVSRSGSAIPISRAEVVRAQVESNLAKKIPSALTVREKPRVEVFSTGIAEVDLVHQQVVTYQQGFFHGLRWNLERLNNESNDEKNNHDGARLT